MKIAYAASHSEMTSLSKMLVERHRGRIALRFTETGVVAELETAEPVVAANIEEALAIADADVLMARAA